MRNPFKNDPLTIADLVKWTINPLTNPKTGKPIKDGGGTYIFIKSIYLKKKSEVDNLIKNQDQEVQPQEKLTQAILIDVEKIKKNLLNCFDDRDPISMNIFWKEINCVRVLEYSEENYGELVFYYDSKNNLRCLEKETLKYLKSYGLMLHPVTQEPIPPEIFILIETLDIQEISKNKSIDDMALDVFQYFSKISIFIDYTWFMELSKDKLLKFNYELGDFWKQNFSDFQRKQVCQEPLLVKTNDLFNEDNTESIQKYLLEQMELMLKCENEELRYMINYIILGALSIVIPTIKELYPDFIFSF
jgi:hypothetical protein